MMELLPQLFLYLKSTSLGAGNRDYNYRPQRVFPLQGPDGVADGPGVFAGR